MPGVLEVHKAIWVQQSPQMLGSLKDKTKRKRKRDDDEVEVDEAQPRSKHIFCVLENSFNFKVFVGEWF